MTRDIFAYIAPEAQSSSPPLVRDLGIVRLGALGGLGGKMPTSLSPVAGRTLAKRNAACLCVSALIFSLSRTPSLP